MMDSGFVTGASSSSQEDMPIVLGSQASMVVPVTSGGLLIHSPWTMLGAEPDSVGVLPVLDSRDAVVRELHRGGLVGVATDAPGLCCIEWQRGEPGLALCAQADAMVVVAVDVRDRILCVRDLGDLGRWTASCPPCQSLELSNGFYRLTLLLWNSSMRTHVEPECAVSNDTHDPHAGATAMTSNTAGGLVQRIGIHVERVPRLPLCAHTTMPELRARRA